jgi:7,8-dihydroneopterin aldolase/epimerase/oxygenase
VSDRIVVAGMVFLARHGVNDWEKVEEQRFEVDVELVTDTRPAGTSDDLARTVDYRRVYAIAREVLEDTTSELIETLAEKIAGRILAANGTVDEVVVRVRKPDVDLGGPLEYAGVEIRRRRDGSATAG